MLFNPDELEENYYVGDMDSKPSSRVQTILEDIYERHGTEFDDEDVLAAAEREGYGQSWNDSTIIEKVIDKNNGREYIQMLEESEGKRTLSVERYMEISNAVEVMKNHEFSSHILWDDLQDPWQRLTQCPVVCEQISNVFGSYSGKLKGLLDVVLVNHDSEVIYPWDLKYTSAPATRFESQFVKFKYYLQAGLYSHILETIVAECGEGGDWWKYTGLDFNPAGYSVANFGFIVVSSQDTLHPIQYRCTDQDIYSGIYGGVTNFGKEVKGVLQLAQEYRWHEANDKWDYPYEVYKNGGCKDLNVFQ